MSPFRPIQVLQAALYIIPCQEVRATPPDTVGMFSAAMHRHCAASDQVVPQFWWPRMWQRVGWTSPT
jgi:hypothetical protein